MKFLFRETHGLHDFPGSFHEILEESSKSKIKERRKGREEQEGRGERKKRKEKERRRPRRDIEGRWRRGRKESK